jgi:hypothetical protein
MLLASFGQIALDPDPMMRGKGGTLQADRTVETHRGQLGGG